MVSGNYQRAMWMWTVCECVAKATVFSLHFIVVQIRVTRETILWICDKLRHHLT